LYAPLEVKLWPDGPAREPDILFIRQEHLEGLTDRRFEGAPDLVIEIVSTSSVSEDRVRKFTEYERAGVREYWIIDPRPFQQQADFYTLGDDGLFYPAPIHEGVFHSTVLPHFWLRLGWLWEAPLPNVQQLFAGIMLSRGNYLARQGIVEKKGCMGVWNTPMHPFFSEYLTYKAGG